MYDDTMAKNIAKQQDHEPLTNFSSIVPNTDLKTLNLNWRESDLPEKLRTKHVHRLHPYMGKFIPQLVEIFLRKYEPKLVYDPFCGSGTTLVEANTLGINSIGTDISCFNILLSKVKTDEYDLKILHKECYDILKRLSEYRDRFSKIKKGQMLFDDYNEDISSIITTDNEYLKKWFATQSLKELLCYQHLIKDYQYQDLLKIILCRSARSARLVTHYDLDFPKKPQIEPYHCHKHNRTCEPTQEAYKFLVRYTIDTYERVKEFSNIRTNATVELHHADSRIVKLPRNIDLVITSPPYLGLIDYHEQHRYAYELLGLKNNETKEIGAAKEGKSDNAKQKYIDGIDKVIKHTKRYMADDGIMVIVVNDKYNLYKPDKVGFEGVERLERHVNRRTGRRNGAFYESILIWRKI